VQPDFTSPPSLQALSAPGNALHISAFVAGVAASAFRDHQRIGNRNPFFVTSSWLPAILALIWSVTGLT